MSSLPLNRPELHEALDRLRRALSRGLTRTGNYDIWWEEGGNRITVTHHKEVIFKASNINYNNWFSSDLDFNDLLTHLRQVMVLDDVADA